LRGRRQADPQLKLAVLRILGGERRADITAQENARMRALTFVMSTPTGSGEASVGRTHSWASGAGHLNMRPSKKGGASYPAMRGDLKPRRGP
jgi:hypothetical protein